jgi:hypothetical protein
MQPVLRKLYSEFHHMYKASNRACLAVLGMRTYIVLSGLKKRTDNGGRVRGIDQGLN